MSFLLHLVSLVAFAQPTSVEYHKHVEEHRSRAEQSAHYSWSIEYPYLLRCLERRIEDRSPCIRSLAEWEGARSSFTVPATVVLNNAGEMVSIPERVLPLNSYLLQSEVPHIMRALRDVPAVSSNPPPTHRSVWAWGTVGGVLLGVGAATAVALTAN